MTRTVPALPGTTAADLHGSASTSRLSDTLLYMVTRGSSAREWREPGGSGAGSAVTVVWTVQFE
eukprot:COSAG04_NODE_323_length_16882_cov_5.975627_4_plen_64_part_00